MATFKGLESLRNIQNNNSKEITVGDYRVTIEIKGNRKSIFVSRITEIKVPHSIFEQFNPIIELEEYQKEVEKIELNFQTKDYLYISDYDFSKLNELYNKYEWKIKSLIVRYKDVVNRIKQNPNLYPVLKDIFYTSLKKGEYSFDIGSLPKIELKFDLLLKLKANQKIQIVDCSKDDFSKEISDSIAVLYNREKERIINCEKSKFISNLHTTNNYGDIFVLVNPFSDNKDYLVQKKKCSEIDISEDLSDDDFLSGDHFDERFDDTDFYYSIEAIASPNSIINDNCPLIVLNIDIHSKVNAAVDLYKTIVVYKDVVYIGKCLRDASFIQ